MKMEEFKKLNKGDYIFAFEYDISFETSFFYYNKIYKIFNNSLMIENEPFNEPFKEFNNKFIFKNKKDVLRAAIMHTRKLKIRQCLLEFRSFENIIK